MKKVFLIGIIIGAVLLACPVFSAPLSCIEVVDEALNAYKAGDIERAQLQAEEGIRLCQEKAIEQQQKLIKEASTERRIWISPDQSKLADDQMLENWQELNAMGAALFLKGEILKQKTQLKESRQCYLEIVNKYPDAYQQAYQGWYWNLAELAQDTLDTMETPLDYGDYNAGSLIKKAWQAYHNKDYESSRLFAEKCLKLYDNPDLSYQMESVVAHFLLAKMYLNKKQTRLAQEEFNKVTQNYPNTIYPNVNNYPYFNNITQKAQDHLALMETLYDFGNYSSETLTIKAWKSWDKSDFKGVELYARKCIELWGEKARQMQKQMDGFAQGRFIPYFWAVNDVGTCHFILGMAYQKQANLTKAREMYAIIIKDFGYAQCWDPRGHYWKVAEVSQMRLAELDKK